MAIDVYVYDDTCAVLSVPLDISVMDKTGVILASVIAGPVAGKNGARLAPTPPLATFGVCRVQVDDLSGTFYPYAVEYLNGNAGVVIEAVIEQVPTSRGGSGGSSPATLADIHTYIDSQTQWSSADRGAVRRFVAFFSSARLLTGSTRMKEKIRRWGEMLEFCGIPTRLWKSTSARTFEA